MLINCQRLNVFIFLIIAIPGIAQQNSFELLKSSEDSCLLYSKKLLTDISDSEKNAFNDLLIKKLEFILNVPGSFDYPLDSLKWFGKIEAPDKSFRLITWNISFSNNVYKYYGFIQVPNGNAYKIFKLIDRSDEISDPENSVLSAGKWFGALYYHVLKEKVANRTYYTLLALQYHTLFITKKMIDILYFDEYGNPVFGAPIIMVNKKLKHRLVFTYSALSVVNLKFDNKLNMIIFDHVAAAEPKFNGQYEYYGPDLTFDGLAFKKGYWVYMPNLDLRQKTDPDRKYKPLR